MSNHAKRQQYGKSNVKTLHNVILLAGQKNGGLSSGLANFVGDAGAPLTNCGNAWSNAIETILIGCKEPVAQSPLGTSG